MRLAVVSDVHGNLTALEAVVADLAGRGVDQVVHGGDLALIGARPREVVETIRELGWPGVVGNTDELLWRPELLATQLERMPKLEPLLRMLFEEYGPVTGERLGADHVGWLRELPERLTVGPVSVVHASPGDLWRAPPPAAPDTELEATYATLPGGRAVYGHIHRPYARQLAGRTIANAGSVGLPWDGDPRASYLISEPERVELVRVAYDIEAEVRALRRSGYPDRDRIAAMLRGGRPVPVASG